MNMLTPHVSILHTIVNPTPLLTQVAAQKHHLEVLIGQMNLTITSPMLAGRLAQFITNREKITQDRWVLQALKGYQLELVQLLWQLRPMPAISCSVEESKMISTEIIELLSKSAVVETTPSQGGFVSQIFLVEKKEGGQRPVINLKALNTFMKHEHFKMEGLHTLPDLIQQEDWMIKLDLKDAYLQVPIHTEHQHLLQFQWGSKTYQFQCLPFGLTSAPRVFSKIMKPVVGALRHMGIRLVIYLDDILVLHQSMEELAQLTPLICQLFEALGLVVNRKKSIRSGTGSQSEEIYTDSTPESGVLGLPSRHSQPTAHFPIQEVEENTAASPTPPSPTKCFGERLSEVCGEGLSLDTGYMASSSTFQSTAVFNQLCVSGEPSHGDGEHCQKVQHPLDLDQRGQGQPRMVVCSRQEDPNAISSPTPGTDHDNRVRCLQHGVGSSTRRAPDGWKVVSRGNLSPHNLSRTTSCLSSAAVLCQVQQRDHRPNEVGRCHGGDIHQQARGNALPGTLSARIHDLGLVCTEGCFSGCRTPTREGQYNSRSGIVINEG